MLLLIDNYDSFTYNLVHFLGDLGAEAVVRRNDALTVQDAMAMNPSGIVLSPGPGTPSQSGICLAMVEAAAETGIPLLGVCLGHQTIGQAFGGRGVSVESRAELRAALTDALAASSFTVIAAEIGAREYDNRI